jgi:hypothetical protein
LKLTDQSPFPIGKKYRGTKMEDVPADHLLWWWDDCGLWNRESLWSEEYFAVHDYIKENFSALETEAKDRIVQHRP